MEILVDEKADPRRLKGIKRPGEEGEHYMEVADDMLANRRKKIRRQIRIPEKGIVSKIKKKMLNQKERNPQNVIIL